MGGERLAIEGGTPVRTHLLPYGGQWLVDEEIAAVADALRSPWLTGGALVDRFEGNLAAFVGASHAVAVSSGTAALHAATYAAGIRQGDEVVTTPLTFVASANCVLYQGGTPVFVDVEPATLNIDPAAVEAAITPRTRAIIAVHYGGHPCDLAALRRIAASRHLPLIEDACHALGARYFGESIGADSDFAVFSFHPVKLVTTGEGGAITCHAPEAAARMRGFRSHGIRTTGREREASGQWSYEVVDLGYNYRLTDFQCALGVQQLSRANTFLARRREIVRKYQEGLAECEQLELPREPSGCESAWHLFVIRLRLERLRVNRDQVYQALRAEGIGVNVHYIPVHLHPYYRQRFGWRPGQFPAAEQAFQRLLTLPLFPRMSDRDVEDVIAAIQKVVAHYAA